MQMWLGLGCLPAEHQTNVSLGVYYDEVLEKGMRWLGSAAFARPSPFPTHSSPSFASPTAGTRPQAVGSHNRTTLVWQ